METSWRNCWLN